MKISPSGRMVLIRRIDAGQTKSRGGIILPDSAKKSLVRAEVLAVGPGLINEETGLRMPTDVKVGQHVLIPSYSGNEVPLPGENLYLIPAPDIEATYEEVAAPKSNPFAAVI